MVINIKVITYSLIFLVGGTFTIAAISIMDYPFYFSYLEYTEEYPFTLSVAIDTPQWNHTLDHYFIKRIGITSLETNDTEVDVLFLDSDSEVLMQLSNVTAINEVAVSIAVSGESTIVIERVDSDASVNLIVMLLLELPPPPVPPSAPWPGIFFSLFIALVGFLLLISVRIRHTDEAASRWGNLRRIQPYWIALLILLSLVLMAPYISGAVDRSFIPREQTELLDSGSQTFIINSVNPSEYQEISAGSMEDSSYNFSAAYHLVSGMNYGVSIQSGLGSDLFRAVVNSSIPWLIEGGMTSGANLTLNIERAAYDAELGLYFDVTRTFVGPNVDPAMSTVLAIVGLGVLFIALFLGGFIESEEEPQES
jgi:hypothetical protein